MVELAVAFLAVCGVLSVYLSVCACVFCVLSSACLPCLGARAQAWFPGWVLVWCVSLPVCPVSVVLLRLPGNRGCKHLSLSLSPVVSISLS